MDSAVFRRDFRQQVLNRFEFTSYFFDPGALTEDIVMQFHVTDERVAGNGVTFYLATEGARCDIHEGRAARCDVEIEVDYEYWCALQAKKLSRLRVLLDLAAGRRVRVSGRRSLFFRLGAIFGGTLDDRYLRPKDVADPCPVKRRRTRPRNVVILSGSGRDKRSATSYHFARLFADGAACSGNVDSVRVVHLRDYKIRACKGCFKCWSTDGRCAIDDQYTKVISPLLDECDLLVLAFPLYFYDFPPEIRNVITRFFSHDHPLFRWNASVGDIGHYDRKPYTFSIFLLGVGGALDRSQFEIPKRQIELLSGRHGIPFVGSIFRTASNGFLIPAARTPRIEEVERAFVNAGTEICCSGSISRRTRRLAEQPVITAPQLRAAAYAYYHSVRQGFKYPYSGHVSSVSEFDIGPSRLCGEA